MWQLTISVPKCSILSNGRILNLLNLGSTLLALLTFLELSLVQTWALSSTTNSHFHVIYSLQSKKAYKQSTIMSRCFLSKNPHLLKSAFTSYDPPNSGRMHPQFGLQHSTNDIDCSWESPTPLYQIFLHIRSLPYSTCLTRLDLQPLNVRRNHLDLITCFRLVHGLSHLDYTSFFSPRLNSVTRGHPYTLIKPPVRLNTSKFSFFSRTVDPWNNLPLSTITASSLPSLSNLSWNIHQSLNLF